MKQCFKCNKEVMCALVICDECAKKANQHFRNQEELPEGHGLMTMLETPKYCPNCAEHISPEWSFCPNCGRPTDWGNMSR